MSQVPPPPPIRGQSPTSTWQPGPAGHSGGVGSGGGPTHAPGGVASLVFGVVGLTVLPVIGSIVALVFGYQSRNAARAEPGRYNDQLGQIGRVLGWIGLGLAVGGLLIAAVALLFFVAFSATVVALLS